MGLKDEIAKESRDIFRVDWDITDGRVVPSDSSLTLGNKGIRISATILYADLADSTRMVRRSTEKVSAEIYKSFLSATCKVIRANGGEITAFDGDRVMAVFIGDGQNTEAAQTALQINYAIKKNCATRI